MFGHVWVKFSVSCEVSCQAICFLRARPRDRVLLPHATPSPRPVLLGDLRPRAGVASREAPGGEEPVATIAMTREGRGRLGSDAGRRGGTRDARGERQREGARAATHREGATRADASAPKPATGDE